MIFVFNRNKLANYDLCKCFECDGEGELGKKGYWQQKYIMQLCTCLGVLFLILVDPFHILWRQSNLIFFKFGKTLCSKLLKEVEILFLIQ